VIPNEIYQLGLAATVLFIVLLILTVAYKIIKAVLDSNDNNDKSASDNTKSWINMLTSLSTAINNNSMVLSELKEFIASEKKTTRDTLTVLETKIVDRFGTTDRKIDLVIKMIGEVQQSLEDTLQPKADEDGETRL
jgi:hypothetical protein